MTIETRGTIKLEDITAVEYECKKCGTKSVRLMDEKHKVAGGCGNCSSQWMADGSQEHKDLEMFVNVIRNFTRSNVNTHVSVRLQIEGLGDRK